MLKRLVSIIILIIFIIAVAAGCSAKGASAPRPSVSNGETAGSYPSAAEDSAAPEAPAQAAPPKSAGNGVAQHSESTADISLAVDPNRKLIRTGSLDIESLDFEASLSALDQLLARLGGYIENSSVTGVSKLKSGKQQMRSAHLTVRVPSKQFDAFLKGSGDIGNILQQTTSADDVTDSYYDTEARLKSQQMMEQRLLDLLSKSDKLTDIISLEQSLSDTRYEIEKLTGTLKKWDALVEYSTFSVSIQEVMQISDLEPLKAEPKTLGQKVSSKFVDSIKGVRDGLSAFVVFFAGAVPYLVIWGAIIVLLWLIYRKIRGKSDRKRHWFFQIRKNRPDGEQAEDEKQDKK